MRLKFKPQSTFCTCGQATQAIALNSLLGTDYTDLDVIASSNHGYPLLPSTIDLAKDLVLKNFPSFHNIPDFAFSCLSSGIYVSLETTRSLPSYEEAIQAYIERSKLRQQNSERKLREKPYVIRVSPHPHQRLPPIELTPEEVENRIKKGQKELEDIIRHSKELEKDETTRRFYHELIRYLDENLLKPIGYRFSTEIEYDDFSGLLNLSSGSLVVENYDVEQLRDVIQGNDIVIFSTHRNELGLQQYSQQASHVWIVDRIEGDVVILLDTNHHMYGHGPEIYVPLSKLLEVELKYRFRIHPK